MLNRIDNVLTAAEIAQILAVFAAVGPVSGRTTARGVAAEAKHNLQLPQDNPQVQAVTKLVLDALKRNPEFFAATFPRRAFPPLFSRYEPGMTYGEHVDNSIMNIPKPMRTDVAVTLFLSDPASYDGGELIVLTTGGETSVKLPAGSLVAYPPTYVHRVAPVTRGTRYAAVSWIESMLRDAEQRRVLHELDRAMTSLHARLGDSAELTALNSVYHTLMRMWAEP